MDNGARLKKTALADDFTYEKFLEQYGETARVLFIFPESGKVRIATADQPLEPKAGMKVLALVDPPEGGFNAAESGILR